MALNIILFFAGLLLLYYGAEYLITGSTHLALSYGVRPLVIGLTVISFATSMPEMMVSLFAAVKGSSAIAAGNIIGSNVANIGLILGSAALLFPIRSGRGILFRELPYMVVASVVVYGFSWDGQLTAGEGVVLLFMLAAFLFYCIRTARDVEVDTSFVHDAKEIVVPTRGRWVAYVILGMVGLGIGAELMVRSAVAIALTLGVSEAVIGMSVVAVGTSLPELAASVVSAWKGEMEMSVGNVIGSNIFNLLFVFGFCTLIRPVEIERSLLFCELPLMILFSVALWPLMYFGHALDRKKGLGLLAAYAGFMVLIFQ